MGSSLNLNVYWGLGNILEILHTICVLASDGNSSILSKIHANWREKVIFVKTGQSSLDTNLYELAKQVYHGEFSNFELPLLVRNSIYVSQVLSGLSYIV